MPKNQNLEKAVIDINDVEYLIDENAAALIKRGEAHIGLIRLVDRAVIVFELNEILESIREKGIIDRLN